MKKQPLHIWGDNWTESYLRKRFNLKGDPKSAVLRIFADTGYELYINGQFVATINEWVNNRDYDVTPYLRHGKNTIAVRALNYGGHRGLVVELRCIEQNNSIKTVLSDSSWKASSEERWGWREVDYNDTKWKKAQVLNTTQTGAEQWCDRPGSCPEKIIPCLTGTPFFQGEIPKYTDSPFYTSNFKTKKVSPAIKKLMGKEYSDSCNEYPREIIIPVKVCEYDAGNGDITGIRSLVGNMQSKIKVTAPKLHEGPVIFMDFGEEMAGYLRIAVDSKEGVRVRLLYGETLSECNNMPPRDALVRRMVTEDVFISAGKQEWESRTKQGFRFLRMEIAECPNGATITAVNVRTSVYPVNYTGYFSCSDSLLNKIWSVGRRTLHLCMQEYYLDAIKRDRFLWVGDLRLEALINYYLFGDLELFRCSCSALAKTQYPDGAIPSVLGEGAPVLWDYVAWWLVSFEDYYTFSGDRTFLKEHKEQIIKAAKYLANKAGRDGLVDVPRSTTKSWMCILSNVTGKDPEFNVLYYRAMNATAIVLNAINDKKTGSYFLKEVHKLSASYKKKFGISPDEYITDRNSFATGSLNSFERCDAYFKNNKALEGLNNIRENWKGMLGYGSDTFWETVMTPQGNINDKEIWERYNLASHCHGWTASPSYILPAYVAGIRPISPGFKTFIFNPQLGDLKNVNCAVPTPNGEIVAKISAKANTAEAQLYVPTGCKAEVVLPCLKDNITIKFNGKKLTDKKMPKLKSLDETCSFKLQKAGLYTFLMKLTVLTNLC